MNDTAGSSGWRSKRSKLAEPLRSSMSTLIARQLADLMRSGLGGGRGLPAASPSGRAICRGARGLQRRAVPAIPFPDRQSQ
jgi:hypothetical protein